MVLSLHTLRWATVKGAVDLSLSAPCPQQLSVYQQPGGLGRDFLVTFLQQMEGEAKASAAQAQAAAHEANLAVAR